MIKKIATKLQTFEKKIKRTDSNKSVKNLKAKKKSFYVKPFCNAVDCHNSEKRQEKLKTFTRGFALCFKGTFLAGD